jgi:transposase InsO family protein
MLIVQNERRPGVIQSALFDLMRQEIERIRICSAYISAAGSEILFDGIRRASAMAATDVTDTLQVALQVSGLDQVNVLDRLRLLSDNGPSYVSSELGEWLENKGIRHIRGRAYHPMTQGKIERYHRSMTDPARELLSATSTRTEHRRVRRVLQ